MGNSEKIIVKNSEGIEKEAEILTELEIDNQKYVVYSVDKDEKNVDILVSRLVSDDSGEIKIESILNPEERTKVFSIVEQMLDSE